MNLIGHSLGRYHILEQLGEGGMATVYKAYDTRLEADVAVKVIRTENLAPSILARALKRFEREAQSLAKLTHANIVKVLDYGEYKGKPYLVMPYLPGGTLKAKLNGQPIPWQDATHLLLPIARALGYAHEQGMVHRDVKPANILITHSGDPMLTDFGIAKIIDEEATQDLTGTSAAMGTPEYMAPEQVTAKSVDHRADIYALGVVFYEMVTGRRPFQADTPMAVLFKHASEPLPRPTQFAPELPDAVEKILLKALAKDPSNRYASMEEFIAALDKLSQNQLGVLPAKTPIWRIAAGTGLGGLLFLVLWALVVPRLIGIGQFFPNQSLKPIASYTPTRTSTETSSPTLPSETPMLAVTTEPTVQIETYPTDIAEMNLTPLNYGKLLYEDSFDKDDETWSLQGESTIKDGFLTLQANTSAGQYSESQYSDFIFETVFRHNNADGDSETCFYLRQQVPHCPGWNCSIQIWVSGDWKSLGSRRVMGDKGATRILSGFSASELSSTDWNKITIIAKSDEYKIFVNTIFIVSFTDSTFKLGTFALSSSSGTTIFDYVRIYALP